MDSTTFLTFSLLVPIDSLSCYINLTHGKLELHRFTSSQRETYRFHRVTQSFPLLEWHRYLAPSPVVIAGSTLFISQNLFCLLQFLKSLHWKTNQKMSNSLLEELNSQTIILISLEYVSATYQLCYLEPVHLLKLSFLICKVYHKDK